MTPAPGLAIPLDLEAVAALCRRFHVRRLDVFGSAVAGDFDPDRSDLDLLVAFEDVPEARSWRNLYGLMTAFEELAGRKVDVVEDGTIRNPFVLREVERQRRPLWQADA